MFINGLGDFNICRCFPKPDPTSLLVAPMRLLGIGSFRGVTWRRSSSPSPQSMRHNPKRRPSSCATPLFPASCARLRRSGQVRTIEELCKKFMEDYSKKRNKPSTRVGYQGVIDRYIIPLLGRKKVHDVKRPDVAGLMEKLSYKQTEANKAFSILRKMFSMSARRCPKSRLCAVGGCRRSRRQGRSVPYARLRPGGRLRPLTACAAPYWPRFRAIPPVQPEHDPVATVLFLVRYLTDGARCTGPLPASDGRPNSGGHTPGYRVQDAARCVVQFSRWRSGSI